MPFFLSLCAPTPSYGKHQKEKKTKGEKDKRRKRQKEKKTKGEKDKSHVIEESA